MALRERVLARVRRFTRRALDRLDPPEPAPAAPPAPEPAAARASAPSTPVTVRADATPNPNAVKLTVSPSPGWEPARSFPDAVSAASDPLGRALFAVPGVTSVFAVDDFVTVGKEPSRTWDALIPELEDALRATL